MRPHVAVTAVVLLVLGVFYAPGIAPLSPAAGAPNTVGADVSSHPAGAFVSVAPMQLLDTGAGKGAPKKPVAAHSTLSLQVTGRGGVPSSGAGVVVMNVTV